MGQTVRPKSGISQLLVLAGKVIASRPLGTTHQSHPSPLLADLRYWRAKWETGRPEHETPDRCGRRGDSAKKTFSFTSPWPGPVQCSCPGTVQIPTAELRSPLPERANQFTPRGLFFRFLVVKMLLRYIETWFLIKVLRIREFIPNLNLLFLFPSLSLSPPFTCWAGYAVENCVPPLPCPPYRTGVQTHIRLSYQKEREKGGGGSAAHGEEWTRFSLSPPPPPSPPTERSESRFWLVFLIIFFFFRFYSENQLVRPFLDLSCLRGK